MLCLDSFTFQTISSLNIANIKAISLTDIEANDQELLKTKQTRNKVEYYFTCSPILPLYLLKHFPYIDAITYLDSDLFFYADPSPIFREFEDKSILIMEHNYSRNSVKKLNLYGKYNVGFLTFRNDINAQECLTWWREKCVAWCYNRVEHDLFADQKYLDQWPLHFKGVKIVEYKAANIAFWNWEQYKYSYSTQDKSLYIGKQKLIFCHFSHFKQINRYLYTIIYGKKYFTPSLIRQYCISPYIEQLQLTKQWLIREKDIILQPQDLYEQASYFRVDHGIALLTSLLFGNLVFSFRHSFLRGEKS